MANIYNEKRAQFSKIAHSWAVEKIYPRIFPNINKIESVTGHTERERILDGELGIDTVVHLNVPKPAPGRVVQLSVQERWRPMEYRRYQDITITDGNRKTGSPTESRKLVAQFFFVWICG